ncbi:MAG: LamG-like jellyroll fold domain-containing protein [Verrucomicrobiota bacterium JB024]|nr:LamG-like jellyroll fold domain-containing protein [Verrucomicrobiota bacterium JB024]
MCLSPLRAAKVIELPQKDWAFTCETTDLGATEAAWIELRDTAQQRLYRLGVDNGVARVQAWQQGGWKTIWHEKVSELPQPVGLGVFRINGFLFFEAGDQGALRQVIPLGESAVPTVLEVTSRLSSSDAEGIAAPAFRSPLHAPVSAPKETKPMQKESFACYIPWFPADYTALGYQRQYDFPLVPLRPSPDFKTDVLTEQYRMMTDSGITTLTVDMVFFNADRVRAGVNIFKRQLDAIRTMKGEGIQIVPFLELKEIPAAIAGSIYLLDRYGDDPHWLKTQGRPVFLTYHNEAHVDMTPEMWRSLVEGTRAGGYDSYWIYNFEGIQVALTGTVEMDTAPDIVKVSDGVFHFGGSSLTDSGKFASFIRKHFSEQYPNMTVGGSIHPGYYAARTYSRNLISQRHTAELRENWEYLKAGNPDFVHLTTWNDWNEATSFCPSYGDIGARLEIVSRFMADFFGTPIPAGSADVPEWVLSFRKEVYPGEPFSLEVLPLPTQKGPKEGQVYLKVTTRDGEVLLDKTSPVIDFTKMEPWMAETLVPDELEAPTLLKVEASFKSAGGKSVTYYHLPDVMVAETHSYGDQLYYNIPVHRLAPADQGLFVSVNGVEEGPATGSGLFTVDYAADGPDSTLVAGSRRGHLMRFLAPLDVVGAEVTKLNEQVTVSPRPADAPQASAEWQARWSYAERGAEYFAAVAQFADGTWAYSPTVYCEPVVKRDRLLAEWVFSGPKPALMGNVAGLDKPQAIIEDRSIYGNNLPIPEDCGSKFIDLPGNGRALRFDGRTLLKPEDDSAANGPVAVEALFRLTEANKYQVIAMQRGAQATLVIEDDGHLAALRLAEFRRHPNPFTKAYSQLPLEAGRFYHAVVTYDGRELSLYLDGELQESVPCVGTRSTEGFALGGPAGNPVITKAVDEMPVNGFFTGDLVKFSIFGQALSADQVAELDEVARMLPFWNIKE